VQGRPARIRLERSRRGAEASLLDRAEPSGARARRVRRQPRARHLQPAQGVERAARVGGQGPRGQAADRPRDAGAGPEADPVGERGEAAALLEQDARGFQKEEATRKWRREHPSASKKPLPALYDEAKAQSGLHDAAILREARGELKQAIADRSLSLRLWKKTD